MVAGIHFKAAEPVVRNLVIVLRAAEPGVGGALWLRIQRHRRYLGQVIGELYLRVSLWFAKSRVISLTRSRFCGEPQLDIGQRTNIMAID